MMRWSLSNSISVMPGALVRMAGDALSGWYRKGLARYEPGPATLSWDGRDSRGRLVRSAKLLLRVRATNSIGTVDLVAPFAVKRVA